jgi:hypothetical protein
MADWALEGFRPALVEKIYAIIKWDGTSTALFSETLHSWPRAQNAVAVPCTSGEPPTPGTRAGCAGQGT